MRPSRGPFLRLAIALSVPVLLVAGGTIGYRVVEGWPLFDDLYMTVVTLTTVGGEVHPLTPSGRTFTILLLLGGVFTLFYAATTIIAVIVSGELGGGLGRRRMERRLADLNQHVVVCGYGRMGRLVCREFAALGMPFAVVDRQPGIFEGVDPRSGISLQGDGTSEEVLRRAGIERARVLVTVVASDADNLYITMSARLLNEKVFIVARAEEEEAEKKLLRAGANRVVSPYVIGGQRVAQAVLRPAVVDFIELATRSDYMELQLEEVEVRRGSALAGAMLKDSRIRQDLGIIIVAIKKTDGRMVFNPGPDGVLEPGDLLITLGHREQLARLEALSRG